MLAEAQSGCTDLHTATKPQPGKWCRVYPRAVPHFDQPLTGAPPHPTDRMLVLDPECCSDPPGSEISQGLEGLVQRLNSEQGGQPRGVGVEQDQGEEGEGQLQDFVAPGTPRGNAGSPHQGQACLAQRALAACRAFCFAHIFFIHAFQSLFWGLADPSDFDPGSKSGFSNHGQPASCTGKQKCNASCPSKDSVQSFGMC